MPDLAAPVVTVRVKPRASRDQIQRDSAGGVLVSLTAAPVEGEANASLCAMLAKAFGVAKSSVRVVRGERARVKHIEFSGLSAAAFQARMDSLAQAKEQ